MLSMSDMYSSVGGERGAVCMCVCVCVCERERKRERETRTNNVSCN